MNISLSSGEAYFSLPSMSLGPTSSVLRGHNRLGIGQPIGGVSHAEGGEVLDDEAVLLGVGGVALHLIDGGRPVGGVHHATVRRLAEVGSLLDVGLLTRLAGGG